MSEVNVFTPISQVDATKCNTLGAIQKSGNAYYKYIYNSGSGTINPGCGVYRAPAATDGYVTTTGVAKATRNLPAGIGQVAIASGYYGWVLVAGHPTASVYTHLLASFVSGSVPTNGYLLVGYSSATGVMTGKTYGAFQSFAPFGTIMSGSMYVNCR